MFLPSLVSVKPNRTARPEETLEPASAISEPGSYSQCWDHNRADAGPERDTERESERQF